MKEREREREKQHHQTKRTASRGLVVPQSFVLRACGKQREREREFSAVFVIFYSFLGLFISYFVLAYVFALRSGDIVKGICAFFLFVVLFFSFFYFLFCFCLFCLFVFVSNVGIRCGVCA